MRHLLSDNVPLFRIQVFCGLGGHRFSHLGGVDKLEVVFLCLDLHLSGHVVHLLPSMCQEKRVRFLGAQLMRPYELLVVLRLLVEIGCEYKIGRALCLGLVLVAPDYPHISLQTRLLIGVLELVDCHAYYGTRPLCGVHHDSMHAPGGRWPNPASFGP